MSFGQGGPHGPGGSHQSGPDWAAMADDTAARNRRRRWMLIGGAALTTLAIGGIVATAVVSSQGKDDGKSQSLPSPENLPSESVQPEPSFSKVTPPPPPDPHDFISDAKKDTAPLGADTLFADERLTLRGSTYDKGATGSTKNCASVVSGRLTPAMTGNNCTRMIRATYEKDGVAVTIGVAVFDTEAQATKAKEQAAGNIHSLPGAGVPSFCQATACRLTSNSVGRYAYFTVAGYTSGQAVTESDTKSRQAGADISDFTFRRIIARGEAQASAAATARQG